MLYFEAHRDRVPNVAPCAVTMLSPAHVSVIEPLWSGDNFLQERLLVLMAGKRVTVLSCGETPSLPVNLNPNAPLKKNQHPVAELLQCVLDTLASPFNIREFVSNCSNCFPKWLVPVIGPIYLGILRLLVLDTCSLVK